LLLNSRTAPTHRSNQPLQQLHDRVPTPSSQHQYLRPIPVQSLAAVLQPCSDCCLMLHWLA
jgi:hypothetical protein